MTDRSTAVLLVVVTAALCAPTPAGSAERIVNGGFERGLGPWSYEGEWTEDSAQARSGRGCVSGEVGEPNRGLVLAQTISLRADAVYRLSFWARATNRNKISLWVRQVEDRPGLADFPRIGPSWTRFTRQFAVARDGEYVLEMIVPTSADAPSGRVWVDDVSLEQSAVVPAKTITSAGIHDFPALAADDQGRLYLAWIESVGAVDRLRLAVGRVVDEAAVLTEFPYDPGSTVLESVVLEGSESGAWGCVSAETDAGFDIHCFHIGPRGPTSAVDVTRDAATDIHPDLAVDGDTAWVVWESNRGGARHIWTRRLPRAADDEVEPPQRISHGSGSSYFPAATSDGAGHVWVVWSQSIDGQYDLQLATRDRVGWSGVRTLTANPYLETRPDVAWAGEELWVAWEASTHPGYRSGYADLRRVLAARVGEAGLEAPAGAWEAFPEWASSPRLAAFEAGVALTLRTSQWERGNWNAELYTLAPDGWTAQGAFGKAFGRNRSTPLVERAGRLWAAVQSDNIEGRWNSAVASGRAVSHVALSSDPIDTARDQSPELHPLVLPDTSFNPQQQRMQFGETRPRASIEHGGERLQLYWGQFHEHSEISFDARRVDLPPDENYMVNRDFHLMDFAALTDHGFNLSAHIWNYLGKLARWQHDPGRFVTFLAQEWTSSFENASRFHPHGYYGHRNLILADTHYPRWFNAREGATPTDVWDRLRADGADFIHIPHQTADTGNVPTDWNYLDEEAQPLAEIFQLRGSYEQRGAPREARNTVDGHFLQDAWNDGVIIGVIASPDHGGGLGKAAVYATELTREAILDACRKRRTYGTTGPRIFLDFRVNGALMGEKLPLTAEPVRVSVRASAPVAVTRVEILRRGEVVYDRSMWSAQASVDFTDRRPPIDGDYYYVRVRSGDNLAWSSPVWFLAEPDRVQRRDGYREPVDP